MLHLKTKIANAKAEQTDEDLLNLNKNKGKRAGIMAQSKKQLEDVRDKALNYDPDAYLLLNPRTTKKDVIKEMEGNAMLRIEAENNGVIINELHSDNADFDIPASLKPVKKNSNPFTVTNSETKVIDPTKFLDNE